MNDWKSQLKELYGNHRKIQKSKRLTKEKSKFDSVVGWKNKKGFSSTGAALTAHAAKQQRKNKATYRYRYHGSRLEQINEQRSKDAAAKHGVKDISSVQTDSGKPFKAYQSGLLDRNTDSSFNIRGAYYEIGSVNQEDGSVEIDLDHVRTQSDLHEPRFKSKIEESIYRLKKENLKK